MARTSKAKASKKAVVKTSNKVNKEEFIVLAAKKCDMSIADMTKAFDMFQEVIEEQAAAGKVISLTGLGKFYVQRHKGHPVQFGVPQDKVSNYVVFKYSASNVFNEKLRKIDRERGIDV